MTNYPILFIILTICFISHGCKVKSYVFPLELAGSDFTVIISSKQKPHQTNSNSFRIHPADWIMVQQSCELSDFDAIIVKGEFSFGLAEVWGKPYITQDGSVFLNVSDFACPEPFSDSVYHESSRFYLQIKNCAENRTPKTTGLIFNISKPIPFCKEINHDFL